MGTQKRRIIVSQLVLNLLNGVFLGVFLLALVSSVGANEADSFRISQVCAIQPDFIAFLEILDADGHMVKDIQKDQLSAALGTQALTIDDIKDFSQTDQGVAYILLVDISKSLTEKEFAGMRQVLKAWIDDMGPKDRAAIITFGTEVKELQDFTNEKTLLKNLISQLKPTDKDTQLHAGLARAMEMGSRADPELPSRRVIVTLSDGQDDYAGGMTQQEVLDRMKIDPVPIYAIGYYHPPRQPQKEESLKTLGVFARTSGGSYFRAESNTIPQMFSLMQQRIKKVYQVGLRCPDCKWDGTVRHLQMTFTQKPKILNAGIDIRLLPKAEGSGPLVIEKKSFWKMMYPWGFVGGGVFLLGIITAVIVLAFRKKEEEQLPLQTPLEISAPEPGEFNAYPTEQFATPKSTETLPGGAMPWKSKPSQGSNSGKMLKLTVVRGGAGRPSYEVILADRLVIGRAPNCDIPIVDDKEVSRNHCELTMEDDVVRVTDLGSKNGTIVNGVPITGGYKLQNDDIILVGKTELRITFV